MSPFFCHLTSAVSMVNLFMVLLLPYVSSDNSHTQNALHDNDGTTGGYVTGTGIYDITGPAAQLNFMGYARPAQTARGIHLRLRSRAFIIGEIGTTVHDEVDDDVEFSIGDEEESEEFNEEEEEEERREVLTSLRKRQKVHNEKSVHDKKYSSLTSKLNPQKTVCFISIDTGMGSDLLTTRILQRLEDLLPVIPGESKKLCHRENTSISGTHTHSAPAGFLQYALYQITSKGFSHEVFDTFVEGIAQSIKRAHDNLKPGNVYMTNGLLNDANINRSPTSYLKNPPEERELYSEEGDTDKNMLLLKISQKTKTRKNGRFLRDLEEDNDETLVGVLNWFSVHGTSMNATNGLISGDNKGYASYLMEKHFNPPGTLPGQGGFVAAFASTNLGDVSPNTDGPKCLDTGLPCDISHSSCNGGSAMCVAFGPGRDMFESTEIIGKKQFDHALTLMDNTGDVLDGSVAYRHVFVDMANKEVQLEDGSVVHTCPAALGYSFGAGTTDGPGDFDFTQGTNSSNHFWNEMSSFLSKPTQEEKDCHAPKPILLNTGRVTQPYEWDPKSVPISILKVGKLLILNVPAEFTTMAGRRLRRAITEIAVKYNMECTVTIAGLTNSYTHYVATFEEYQAQRYEAASTLYGPHTLLAYIQEFQRIAIDLFEDLPSISDEKPSNLLKKQISLIPPVIIDTIALGKKFGSVIEDVKNEYVAGRDTATVSFHSANPRNNQRIEGSFLTVDMLGTNGSWITKYVDGDWCTQYEWKGNIYLGTSEAHIKWVIPDIIGEGVYRICHFGTRKSWIGDNDNSKGKDILLPLTRAKRQETKEYKNHRQLKLTDFEGCSRSFDVKKAK